MNRKMLAFLLTLCMILGMMPVSAFAEGEETSTFSGSGTKEEPYLIKDLADLQKLQSDVNSDKNYYAGVYFKQIADINLETVESWTPIGIVSKDHGFMGNYDGGTFKIQNLKITDSAVTKDSDNYAYVGLFGITEGTEMQHNVIKNLTIENVTINTTGHIVAAAVGYPYYTDLDNISVTGNIKITGGNYTAGVVAYTRRCINANNLSVSGNSGSYVKGERTVGGAISDIQMNGGLTANYSNFSTSGITVEGKMLVGGICGVISGQTLDTCSVKDVTLVCEEQVGVVAGSLGSVSTIKNITSSNVSGASSDVGHCYNSGKAVEAKIGDSYYGTLQAAVDAASSDAAVTLMNNVSGEAITIASDKAITLDLNGCSIRSDVSTIVVDGGQLTITDSSEDADGKVITTDATGAYEAIAVKSGGKLSLNGGSIESRCFGIYIYTSGGNVGINGGSVTISGENKDGMAIAVGSSAGALTITGGVFTANGVNYPMYSWGGEVKISGGTFDFAPGDDYVADGYYVSSNGDGTYVISVGLPNTITIGDQKYNSLKDAFANVKENETISINIPGHYIWDASKALPEGVTVKATVDDVVIDNVAMINGTKLMVENIKFDYVNKAVYVCNSNVSELTFTNCTLNGIYSIHVDTSATNCAITFNDCVLTGFATFGQCVKDVKINGGELNVFKLENIHEGGLNLRQNTLVSGTAIAEDFVINIVEEEGAVRDEGAIVNINSCTVTDVDGNGSTPALEELVYRPVDDKNKIYIDGVISYKITLNANGGSCSSPYVYSRGIESLPTPSRSGYNFRGWYIDPDCTTAFDLGEIADDVTVYANWTKKSSSKPSSSTSSGSGGSTTSDPVVSTEDTKEETITGEQVTTTETTVKPETTVTGNTATTEISDSVADKIVEQASKNESQEVVITPEVSKDVDKTEVTISAKAAEKIGNDTDANLTVSTPIADVSISNDGLTDLAKEEAPVSVSAEKKDDTIVIEVKSGDKAVSNVSGGLSVTVPVEEASAGTVAVIVHEDGTEEIVRQTVAEDGSLVIPLEGSATIKIVDNSKDFDDVQEDDWHSDAVDFASSRELFSGTSATTFEPEKTMTRGMLAVVLHNLENNPDHDQENNFPDVNDEKYYSKAVAWASERGLVTGYGNGSYGPDDNITREQLAVILWKHAGCPGSDHELDQFEDEESIKDYAKEAVKWANEHKILNGKGGGKLDPSGNATRAEVAQMLKNYMEK